MSKKVIAIATIIIVILVTLGAAGWQARFNILPQLFATTFAAKGEPFPTIDESNLTATQKKIIALAKTEHAAQPDAQKYSEGNNEAWCADFVSWIYKMAGVPFKNPNSGSWRIPGTYTLRDYLTSHDRLRRPETNYSPKPGDLMLYDNPSSFGQHVNIVLKVNSDGTVTTVGGNEPGGIRVKTHRANQELGFVGYGMLE